MSEQAEIPRADPQDLARRGVEFCRSGHWEGGLALLGEAIAAPNTAAFPGVCYAYLGYGMARLDKRYREGLALCEHGVRASACDPEAYFCLAQTLLLMNRRRKAIGILNRGLALSPHHPGLLDLRVELGVRRPPVISFLARSNPLNTLLGRFRHSSR